MSVEQYSLVAHDWLNLEFIINDLAQRVIGQELGPTSSPTFGSGTITGNLDIGGDLDLSGITDGNIPYMSVSGFADSPLSTDGTDLISTGIVQSTGFARTGWPLSPGVTLSFDDGTRTFTVTDGGSAFYYINGVKYTLGGNKTVVIDDTEGLWFIYFVGSTLTASQTPWVITSSDKALVALVYWDATNNKEMLLGYELHGYTMDAATHSRLHHAGGAAWEDGLLVSDAGSEQLNVSAGEFHDEDIEVDISDGAGAGLFEQALSPAELPIYYRDGASDWRIYETTDKANAVDAAYVDGGNDLHYNKLNGTWASTVTTTGKHVAYFVVATNDQTEPVAMVMGQRIDNNLAAAKQNNVFSGLSLSGLPFQEMIILARVIVKNTGSGVYYTIEDIQDLRATNAQGNVTSPLITDHGGLGGLGDDDHAHYLLADGTRIMTGNLNIQRTNATDTALFTDISGDANSRFQIDIAGKHEWGDGTAVVDTNLYRSASNYLKTDDTFEADVVYGTSGVVVKNANRLYLFTDNTSYYNSFESPTGMGATVTYTLPSADGTVGQVLKTDGSAVLGWTDLPGAGTPGGSDTEIQFNNSSSLDGISSLTFDGSNVFSTANTVWRGGKGIVCYDSDNSNFFSILPNATTTADVIYTWPPADGTSGYLLQTDGSGGLSWGAKVGFTSRCAVYQGSAQTLTTATNEKIEYDTEIYDTDNEFDSTTNYRFTAGSTGYYNVAASISISATHDETANVVFMSVNGTKKRQINLYNAKEAGSVGFNLASDVYLVANDYVEIFGWHNYGSNRNTAPGIHLVNLAIHRFA